MWSKLRLRNFKGYADTDILSLRPLTILIGPNGGGKSTILKFFMTLKQTVESTDTRTPLISSVDEEKGGYVDIGLFKDYVYMGKEKEIIQFELQWDNQDDPRVSLGKEYGYFVDGIKVGLKRGQRKNEVVVESLKYLYGPNQQELVTLSRGERAAYNATIPNFSVSNELSKGKKEFSPQKFYRFSPQMLKVIPPDREEFLRRYASEFEKAILRTYYLGPLRQNPQRYYLATGETPDDLGLKGQKIGTVLYANPGGNLLNQANHWLRELDIVNTLKLSRISRGNLFSLDVIGRNQRYAVNISDYGFGASQILPVIIESLYSPSASTILVEQPEIHLNAHHQLKLPNFFASQVHHQANTSKQFIIETHSEYFLKRLSTLVAKKELLPTEISILYCYADDTGCHIKPIDLDEQGRYSWWPKDFLSEGFEGSAEYIEAIQSEEGEVDAGE